MGKNTDRGVGERQRVILFDELARDFLTYSKVHRRAFKKED